MSKQLVKYTFSHLSYIIRSQQGRLKRALALAVPQKRTIFNMPPHRFYVRFGKLAKYSALEDESLIEQTEYLKPIDHAKMAVQRSFDVSVKQFYRRPLPETCISFCSQKGTEIFKEALVSGHMQSYFRLAAQFRTQDEPAYCGLSTLVMVLNSLEVDPGKLWKGCWRWYHEEMLDCCEPLDQVKEKGINFDQFVCLAHCNYLKADAVRGNEDMLEEKFRELVKSCTQQDDSFIVASYSRPTLLQTGEGHFSPIAGYHPGQDLVLILDVARFKYPPHWVSLKLLVKAMRELDLSTGLPRGYILLQKQEGRLPLLLFRISTALAVTQGDLVGKGVRECIRKWNELLAEKRRVVADFAENKMILGQAISGLLQVLGALPEDCCVLTTQIDMKCDEVSRNHVCAVCQLLNDIESTELYKTLENNLSAGKFSNLSNIGIVSLPPDFAPPSDNCSMLNGVTSAHFLTVLLMSWPYCKEKGTFGSVLGLYADQMINQGTELLKNEILNLKRQLATVFNVFSCSCSKNR